MFMVFGHLASDAETEDDREDDNFFTITISVLIAMVRYYSYHFGLSVPTSLNLLSPGLLRGQILLPMLLLLRLLLLL